MLIKILGSPLLTRLGVLSLLLFGIAVFSSSTSAVKACADAHCHWSIGGGTWMCMPNTKGPFTNCVLGTDQFGNPTCESGSLCFPD